MKWRMLVLVLVALAVVLAGTVFAAPDTGYSGAVVGGNKLVFGGASSSNYITYYSSTYGYQARVAIVVGNNVTVVASTGGACSLVTSNASLYYVVGYVDSANTHYVYIYDREGNLAKSCNITSGLAYTYLAANGVQVIYLKYFSTSATSGGFQEALNYYVNNIDPAIHNRGVGEVTIIWGEFSGNQPVVLNFTVNGQEINAFTWGGGSELEVFWLVENNQSIGVETNHYNFTASLGRSYYIYDENWVSADKVNYTVTVYVVNPDTNESVVADYIRVYNVSNGEVVAEAQNVAEAAFTLPGGDYRFVATKGSSTASVEKSISGNDTVTIWLTPAASSGGSWLYVVAKCPAGQSITAQATLSNSSWSDVKATPANFTVSQGTYTLRIEAEGYETFTTQVDVNGPMVYTATLVPEGNGDNGGSNSTWHWPWEGWNFTNPLDNVKKWLEEKWKEINDPVGTWLEEHGLGWLREWWWLVAIAAIFLVVYLAKED